MNSAQMENPDSDKALQTRTLPPAVTSFADAPHYLLVVQEGSSSVFPLPHTGVFTIGRAPECDLAIDDVSISRRHARIVAADGALQLVDLGSRNGTAVNGDRIDAGRPIFSGDVLTVGQVTLVVNHRSTLHRPREMLPPAALRARLADEVERALHYHRPVSVLALTIGASVPLDAFASALDKSLRKLDVAGWDDGRGAIVVLPEFSQDEALEAAMELLGALAPLGGSVRAGLASCPDDGCDPEVLLAAARASAIGASAGEVLSSTNAATELDLGEHRLITLDPAMQRLLELIRRIAQTDLPILISGETGTGKELAARATHALSPRAQKPFVPLNCAALQETLVESELFGYERGAFSGAVNAKPGLLEVVRGGSVFLDEVGELPLGAQAKLLRALETQRITRVGDVKERAVEFRVIAATNRDLREEVQAGRFRPDLLFRLAAATVVIPPLRERPREIPVLARTFLQADCAKSGRPPLTLSVGALQALARRPWPGNIRELKNLITYLAATVQGDTIEAWHLSEGGGDAPSPARESDPEPIPRAADAADRPPSEPVFRPIGEELRELERRRMVEALEASGGVQKQAARLLGMPLRTFVLKVKQYGLGRRMPPP